MGNFKNVTVKKPSKDLASDETGELIIADITPGGVFAETEHETGMIVVGICSVSGIGPKSKKNMTAQRAVQLLKEANRRLRFGPSRKGLIPIQFRVRPTS